MKTLSESIVGNNNAGIQDRIQKWYSSLDREERSYYKKIDDLHYQYQKTKIEVDKKFNENYPAWVTFLPELSTITISTTTHDPNDLKRLQGHKTQSLYISNFSKTTLENLPLCEVLHITDCRKLTSFPKFTTVSYLSISKCPNITSLETIPDVKERLVISDCDGLTNLSGLKDHCSGSIEIIGCTNLNSLEGCPEKVKGDLIIKDNINLTNINSFPKFVTGTVSIRKNGRDFTIDEIQGRCKTRKVIV